MTNTITGSTAIITSPSASSRAALGQLGATDFLKLLTAELKQQDPTAPVDQKDMLGQLAQFSTLSNQTQSTATLKDIAAKLDTLIAATKQAASGAAEPTA